MIGLERARTTTTVWTIGRTELRRRLRSLRGNSMQLLALLFVFGFGGLFSLAGIAGLFFFGSAVSAGELSNPVTVIEPVPVYLWLFVAGLSGYRLYATGLDPDGSDGLLTTVSHRDLIGGLVVTELLIWVLPSLVLGGLGALAFASGAGSVVAAPLLLLSVIVLVVLGVLTGFLLALGVKNTGSRSRLLTRLRSAFLLALGIAYFGLLITGTFGSVIEPLVAAFSWTPIPWFADLSLLVLSEEASAVRAIGALAFAVVSITVATKLVGVLAGWLWYADSVRLEQTASSTSGESVSRLERALPRPIYGVVRVDWSRARRAPITLSFALYPVIVLVMPMTTTVQTGVVTSSLAILVSLCGAWITGSLFTLNVLGNEGAVLPVTALGVASGRTLVLGHVVAGALVGVPTTVLATATLAVVSPLSVPLAGTLSLAALVLALVAGPIATGIGTLFPRYEAVSVSRSCEAVIPSTIAFGVYSVALVLVATPALLVHSLFINDLLVGWTGLPSLAVGVLGTGLTTALGAVVGSLSLYRASSAVDRFQFD